MENSEDIQAVINSYWHFKNLIQYLEERYPDDSRLKSSIIRLEHLKIKMNEIRANFPEYLI